MKVLAAQPELKDGIIIRVFPRTIRLSLWQFLIVRFLGGSVFIEDGKLSVLWTGSFPLFLIYCSKHGFTITYPQGFEGFKKCIFCAQDFPPITLLFVGSFL
ncbi:hypothetical protein H5T58_02745 [Candidatus Parcubacteria bacterium]|nr:hypothetical protein [Candidatus Parcubacteria bacterium]